MIFHLHHIYYHTKDQDILSIFNPHQNGMKNVLVMNLTCDVNDSFAATSPYASALIHLAENLFIAQRLYPEYFI